jgi:hypothetical protein
MRPGPLRHTTEDFSENGKLLHCFAPRRGAISVAPVQARGTAIEWIDAPLRGAILVTGGRASGLPTSGSPPGFQIVASTSRDHPAPIPTSLHLIVPVRSVLPGLGIHPASGLTFPGLPHPRSCPANPAPGGIQGPRGETTRATMTFPGGIKKTLRTGGLSYETGSIICGRQASSGASGSPGKAIRW